MLHSLKDWTTIGTKINLPKLDKEVIALIEHATEIEEDLPFIERLVLEEGKELLRWRLVEFDSESQEEYLQQGYTVIAWRYNT